MSPVETARAANRLARESSPYLLQHAHNPVQWHPWGAEAFARARREDKPVFLSVGYSTCHWCHVMERESFQRKDVADVLNRHFVAVKVDREQRPDADEIYMNATQLMTGRGGWPNSVWLTPDGRPWHAGTYYPREQFLALLRRLAELWRTRREGVEQQADRVTEAIRRLAAGGDLGGPGRLTAGPGEAALRELRASFDERRGGFGAAPKFPPHGALRLLSAELRRRSDPELLKMLTGTLDAMASGGIRDHIGGGFHRYATDARWLVPHFEKMLYDNAQLLRACAEAFELTGREDYRRVAEQIVHWLRREMTAPEGGFYSALDADSEGEEGRFYLWRHEEILGALGRAEGALFCRVYNIDPDGNFRDEARGTRRGGNIPHLRRPLAASARVEGIEEGELRRRVARGRETLLEVRSRRVRPHLDDKIIAGWNGLTIGALASAAGRLDRPQWLAPAEKAAGFVLSRMRPEGRLVRTWRLGRTGGPAYLDDYAFLAEGLLELHGATGRQRWRDEAAALIDALERHFADPDGGGFFFTADDHESLLARLKSPIDRAVPAGNAVAAQVLVRLGRLGRARQVLEAFAGHMERFPQGTAGMIVATGMYLDAAGPGGPDAPADATRSQADRVAVEAAAPTGTVAPGEALTATVRLTIDPGWHVYAPGADAQDVAVTSVRLVAGPAAAGRIHWPAAKFVRLGDHELPVYEGTVELHLPITVHRDAPPGRTALQLEVRLQPCDDRSCLLPQRHLLRLPLVIAR